MIFATAFVLQRLLTFSRTIRESVVINAILRFRGAVFSIIHCRIIVSVLIEGIHTGTKQYCRWMIRNSGTVG